MSLRNHDSREEEVMQALAGYLEVVEHGGDGEAFLSRNPAIEGELRALARMDAALAVEVPEELFSGRERSRRQFYAAIENDDTTVRALAWFKPRLFGIIGALGLGMGLTASFASGGLPTDKLNDLVASLPIVGSAGATTTPAQKQYFPPVDGSHPNPLLNKTAPAFEQDGLSPTVESSDAAVPLPEASPTVGSDAVTPSGGEGSEFQAAPGSLNTGAGLEGGTPPGQGGTRPGQGGDNPGEGIGPEGTPPGQGGDNPGEGAGPPEDPGSQGDENGNGVGPDGTPPGQGGVNPGNGNNGTPPGQQDNGTPGNSDGTPGDGNSNSPLSDEDEDGPGNSGGSPAGGNSNNPPATNDGGPGNSNGTPGGGNDNAPPSNNDAGPGNSDGLPGGGNSNNGNTGNKGNGGNNGNGNN